jgi:PncC family amidohydrolase
MLGRIAVFDNIDNATEMAKALKYRVRAITLDGQQINVGGSFTGGSVKHGSSILSRVGEIKKLEEESKKIEASVSKLAQTHGALNSDIEKIEREIKALEDRNKIIALMMGSENTKLQQINAKIDANKTLMDKLQEDYDNIVKMGILGVKEETLKEHGAVSNQTAEEMARGVKRACSTDIGISTTGIAGPGGAVTGKPVGTVYIGIAINDTVESIRLDLGSDNSRDTIRSVAVYELLSRLLNKIG